MVNYLDVLFEILLNKSLDFLRDDIIQIVYLIISNNFMLFTTNVSKSVNHRYINFFNIELFVY